MKALNVYGYVSSDEVLTSVRVQITDINARTDLYDKLVQCKKEATFYAIENAHHGGREFWSDQVLDIIEAFIKREE